MMILKLNLYKDFIKFISKINFLGFELNNIKFYNNLIKFSLKYSHNIIIYKNNYYILILYLNLKYYFNYINFIYFLFYFKFLFNFYSNFYFLFINYFSKNNLILFNLYFLISNTFKFKLILFYKYFYNIKLFFNIFLKKNFLNIFIFKLKNYHIKYKYIYYLNKLNDFKLNLIKYLYFLFGINIYIFIKYNILNIVFYESLFLINNFIYIINLFKKYFLIKNTYLVFKKFINLNKNFIIISYLKLKLIINIDLLNFLNLLNLLNLDFILYKNNLFLYSLNYYKEILNLLIKYKNFKKNCIIRTNSKFKFLNLIKNKINIFEVQNNILISEIDNISFTNNKISLKILNPISNSFIIIRSTILPCLIKNLIYNLKYDINKLKLLEIGKIFFYDFKVKNTNYKIKLIKEKYILSLILYNYIDFNNIFFYLNFYFYPLKFNIKFTNFNLKFNCKSNILIIIFDRTVGSFCYINKNLKKIYNLSRDLIILELDFLKFNILNFNYYIKIFFIKRNLSLIFLKNINFILLKFLLKKFFYKNNIINYYYDLILIDNFNNKLLLKLIFFNIKVKLLDFLILKFLYYLNNIKLIVL